MNAIFDVEGECYVVTASHAVALVDELRRQGERPADGPRDDIAAAIVIEHHLVERCEEPIHLTPWEGQAVLAAIFSARGRLYGPEFDALEDALRQRRRLQLGLDAV